MKTLARLPLAAPFCTSKRVAGQLCSTPGSTYALTISLDGAALGSEVHALGAGNKVRTVLSRDERPDATLTCGRGRAALALRDLRHPLISYTRLKTSRKTGCSMTS